MKMLPNSQATFWQETELPLMSSREAFHAKILAARESKPGLEKEPEADYGLIACGLLARYDRNSHSLRTSQTCLVAQAANEADGLALFSQTWPARGMMRNGQIYQLPTLGPGIGGAECGYLPTPTKSADSKGSPKNRYFGSSTCQSNLREHLRNGPDDPVYPNPLFVEGMMGFPMYHTDLPPSETLLSPKSPNS